MYILTERVAHITNTYTHKYMYILTDRVAHITNSTTNTYIHPMKVVHTSKPNVGTCRSSRTKRSKPKPQTLNPKCGHLQIITHQKKQNAKKQLPISTSGLAAIGARTTGQVCACVYHIHTHIHTHTQTHVYKCIRTTYACVIYVYIPGVRVCILHTRARARTRTRTHRLGPAV